jgi:hypothetical protein
MFFSTFILRVLDIHKIYLQACECIFSNRIENNEYDSLCGNLAPFGLDLFREAVLTVFMYTSIIF